MLQKYHLPLMVEEIEDADKFNMLGDSCDKREWLILKDFIKDYLKKQEELNRVDVYPRSR